MACARPFTNAWLLGAVLGCLILQLAAGYWSVLQAVLRTVPLTAAELLVVAVCSLAPVAVTEVVRLLPSPRRGVSPKESFA